MKTQLTKSETRKQNWNGMNWISRTRRLAIYLRDGLQCVYCGKNIAEHDIKLTLDHVVSIENYEGKATDINNLVTCCGNCNFRKQDKTVKEFIKMVATEKKINPVCITNHVKRYLARPINTKLAGQIIKAQGSCFKAIQHLKQSKI